MAETKQQLSLKERIYNKIRDDDQNDLISDVFDGVIITLIIINVLTVILDTFTLPKAVSVTLSVFETISVVIFTIEYIARVWTSDLMFPKLKPYKARLKYIFSFMALIDLFAIVPFYLPFVLPIDLRVLRSLRIIRLLRIFKVNRYTTAFVAIGNVFKKKKTQLLSSIFIVVILMIIASVLMYSVESTAQPEAFGNALDALWWAVATVTTVGYGDVYPITILGKILSGVIALLGIGLVAVPTGIISSGFVEQINKEEKKKHKEEHKFCPYCGHELNE
ncbi:MAG: ion transporter [Lachnospiraceae bacterium]|nr:ion transporter [Lachnospiraceae bacterium]